jgi:hypothetical protein
MNTVTSLDAKQLLLKRRNEIKHIINGLMMERRGIDAALAAYGGVLSLPSESAPKNEKPSKFSNPYKDGLTIKAIVQRALNSEFLSGATALELLDYINKHRDEPLLRSSLSPQLSRLKHEQVIDLTADGIWVLTRKGVPEAATSEDAYINDVLS